MIQMTDERKREIFKIVARCFIEKFSPIDLGEVSELQGGYLVSTTDGRSSAWGTISRVGWHTTVSISSVVKIRGELAQDPATTRRYGVSTTASGEICAVRLS